MRVFFSLFLSVVVLVGCQGDPGSNPEAGQGQIDSLQTVVQNLERQVQTLRDSLRGQAGGTTLTPPVYFSSGSAWLLHDVESKLDEHAQALEQKYSDADFRVQGYTDPVPIGDSLRDTYPSNWYLAAQRAAAVAHYLDKEHDVRSKSLKIEAYGPPQSAAPDETPEQRAKQRRVEIVVEK
jgi:chemotaxis protein MotB